MSMKYSKLLRFLLLTCLPLYAGEEGGGAVIDRGDDFISTDDKEAASEAEAIAAAKAEKDAADAEAARLAAEKEGDKGDDKGDADKGGKDDKKKDDRIPVARHKEILERERKEREALTNELNTLKAGKQIQATNEAITKAETDLEAKEAEYNKHMADGALDKATKTMKDIRMLERSINDQKTSFTIAAAEARAVEQVRFDITVERLEEAYPQIRPGAEEYDQGVVNEMLEMQAAYQAKGYPPSAALQKAVSYILKPTTVKQEKAVTTEARVTDEDKAEALKAQRRADAVNKNVDAAGKTPPNTANVGKDSDKAGGGVVDAKAVMKMKQEDFAKLDEAALSKLRGDEV
jgi:hypothetical protein